MKKYLLTFAMGLLLALALAPAAFAADVTDETSLNSAISNGGTINLQNDISISNTVSIQKAVTINGNGHTITYTNTAQSYAFSVETNEAVTFENVVIDATASSVMNGITVNSNCVPNLTLDKTTLNVTRWGLAFNPNGAGASLTVKNDSVIQNATVSNYDVQVRHGDYRGISLYNAKQATISISDTTIQGFSYTINLAGDLVNGVRDFEGTVLNLTNSTLKGWTAFNVWSSTTYFNITDCYLKGINNSNGSTDGFATIVVNDDIYGYGWGETLANVFTITGGTITNYRSGSASERLFRVDDLGITQIQFVGNRYPGDLVKIIDGTGDSDSVFYAGNRIPSAEWMNNMTENVLGESNCQLQGYNGANISLLPSLT